jgi:hypothetical protein
LPSGRIATLGATPDFHHGLQAAAAQRPATLPDVLARAGAYVQAFELDLSGIVAEETYVQEVSRPRPVGPFAPPSSDRLRLQQRRLRSDLLLMRPESSFNWVQFRDVFEVDGRQVRDRRDRLSALFLSPTPSTLDRVSRIRRESARYNIGAVERTLNVPVAPLAVLNPSTQPRFAFAIEDAGANRGPGTRGGTDPGLPASPNFKVLTEVWVVRFQETREPTLVRTPNGTSIPSHGRFWIEPTSGRVLMSEMIAQNHDVRAQINVSYQSEPLLGLLMPIEMREQYTMGNDVRTIECTATYGNFRQFQVQVSEKIGPIR